MLVTVAAFFILQSVSASDYFPLTFYYNGYSPVSFIGLYLLAQLIRKHFSEYRTSSAYLIFFTCLIFNTICFFGFKFFNHWNPVLNFVYSNPIVILQSLSMLMIFNRFCIKPNKIINWLSASSFAVYLFHVHPKILPIFIATVTDIYHLYNSIECLSLIFGFLCLVFLTAVLLDQPRKLMWRLIQKRFFLVFDRKSDLRF